ncbi:GntR family transcriptional regulator [Alkalibacillus haloalkaliphilus]|uniref:GntR family transcriptional regulator n=1 Tax=Alkalibacillus haloalkaliphilus TaxID=94136 RepID=A0A511W5F7_9BACI|nr:GntR family transcriptional regulator [Alkalibacillus haloalkaliphilus]GEN46320.1 GntR family transcriptional regulator [Alkalibacillus haloalkaliphilus]
MILNHESMKPIYIQIAEWLETEIIKGSLEVDDKIYSQYQLADLLNINPATAGKGLTKLLDDGIVYKRRGLGMFVTENAREQILLKRKNETLKVMVEDLVKEANYLQVSNEELLRMIEATRNKRGSD